MSVCYGCSNSLEPGGQIPLHPHDIVIVANMMLSFQQGRQFKGKQSNGYLFCSPACIRAKQPVFTFCSIPWYYHTILTEQQLELFRNTLVNMTVPYVYTE